MQNAQKNKNQVDFDDIMSALLKVPPKHKPKKKSKKKPKKPTESDETPKH